MQVDMMIDDLPPYRSIPSRAGKDFALPVPANLVKEWMT
jgi:hypothetical protein